MKKWLVYFINSSGRREGSEKILAKSAKIAIRDYQMLFNAVGECRAIPIYDRKDFDIK